LSKNFQYQAIDAHGEKITAYFIGSDDEFQQYIKTQNLFLLSVKNKTKKLKKGKFLLRNLIFFIEELSYLISSGMNLDSALSLIASNSDNETEKEFMLSILQFLKEGNQFSASMELAAKEHHIDMDKLTILLIKTNEAVGKIDIGFLKAKEHLEFNEAILKSIKQAMNYPIFLIIMSISMVFFVFLFIVPKFSTIFTEDEFEKLPVLSKYVLEIGLFAEHNIDYISIGLFSIIAIGIVFKKVILTHLKKAIMVFPFFKNLQINLELSYFFASLGLMLDGGIDLKKALSNSAEIVTYPALQQLVINLQEGIKRGAKLSEVFRSSSLIPSNAVSLIAAGETSSSLNKVFSSLSVRFTDKFKEDVKKYISILEPLVIVLMGGVIAIIVISIMLAVMSITDVV
jgi:general secretion pathway protein F